MSKLPTTPNNLKQPSPDNNGLDKQKETADLNTQAAQVNRDTAELAKQHPVTADESKRGETDPAKSNSNK